MNKCNFQKSIYNTGTKPCELQLGLECVNCPYYIRRDSYTNDCIVNEKKLKNKGDK